MEGRGAIGTQLVLMIEASTGAPECLSAAIAQTPVAAVAIAPPEGHTLDTTYVSDLVRQAQMHGAAALIFNDPRLARAVRADGVHLTAGAGSLVRYREARAILGDDTVVGCDAGASRHDAMTLGEAGADYIAFGLPRPGRTGRPAPDSRFELVRWWAEIFELPCVALDVETPQEAEELVRSGADFVGVALRTCASTTQLAEHVRAMSRAVMPAGGAP